MKVIAQPVEMIGTFDTEGVLKPYKFRYQEETYYVLKILGVSEQKLAGEPTLLFDVLINEKGNEKVGQLKYYIRKTQWVLFKW